MSARLSRWKEVKSTGDKLNKTLDIKIPDIPSKFAPKRDRSESVDKLFNDSRSRAHSSVELSVLNKSRQQQFHNVKKRTFQTERKEQNEKKGSTFYPNLAMGERQTTFVLDGSQTLPAKPSLLIAEMKKQFHTFKKNVLAQLDRQRQMVHKLVKELVLTFQYQFQKLIQKEKLQVEQTIPNMKEDTNIKTIQDWKNKFATISIADAPVSSKIPQPKQSINLKRDPLKQSNQKNQPPKQRNQELQPPKFVLNLDYFLGNIQNLKKQVDDMEKIFNRPLLVTNQKTIRK